MDDGRAIFTRLLRPLSPESIDILEGATENETPRNSRNCLFALPSAGGAVSRIFNRSP